MGKTVNILGTTYTIKIENSNNNKNLEDCDGYCDKTSKEIVVADNTDTTTLSQYNVYQNKVLRHEIIHAFMFESGLAENWEHKSWGQEETVIDWFAIQGLKIYTAWAEADCV